MAQAVFKAAPLELFNRLWDKALQGRLPALAAHPCANFALQAALAGAYQPQQVRLTQGLGCRAPED